MEFVGQINTWKLNGKQRKYITATLSFGEAREVFKPDLYNTDTGQGEQRQIHPSHARALKKDMETDNYTPTAVAVGMNDKVASTLIEKNNGNSASFTVDSNTGHLPLIDGGHRFFALDKLVEQGIEEALKLPITAIIYLDNRNKENFLNAQKGRVVDKSHMLSLQVGAGLSDPKLGPYLKIAVDIARILNTNDKSPFFNMVKFDTRSIAMLPVSTLSAKGASDLGTSLVGSAKIAQKVGKEAGWVAAAIIDAYQAIKTKTPQLLEVGRVLSAPPNCSRGSATMWIGLGNLLAYRRSLHDKDDENLEALVHAAQKICDTSVRGNFSGPKKRELLGEVAYIFFQDINTVEFYNDEIPQGLIDTLSFSTFGIKKPVKKKKVKAKAKTGAKKKPGRKPKPKIPDFVSQEQVAAVPTFTPPTVASVETTTPDGAPVEENTAAPWEQQTESEEVQA